MATEPSVEYQCGPEKSLEDLMEEASFPGWTVIHDDKEHFFDVLQIQDRKVFLFY